MVFNCKFPSVEVTMGPDPDVVPDDTNAIKPTLKISTAAYKNPRPNLKCLQVLKFHLASNRQAITATLRNSANDDASHEYIKLRLAQQEAFIQLDVRIGPVCRSKMRRQPDHELRVLRHLLNAVHRGHYPSLHVLINRCVRKFWLLQRPPSSGVLRLLPICAFRTFPDTSVTRAPYSPVLLKPGNRLLCSRGAQTISAGALEWDNGSPFRY